MSTLKPAVGARDHVQGNADALIELVEYGDYECPHCGRAYPIVKELQEKLGAKLKFVFRNFPLANIHPHAFSSAIASEAAGRQDKFWEMHDMLFEHQAHLNGGAIRLYAKALEMDDQKFLEDMDDIELRNKVEGDFESGVRSGVNGTPTFFVNGTRYNGSWEPESEFYAYLKEALVSSR